MVDTANTFELAFNILQEFEGILSDDAADAGGLTKYGISQRAYPDLDIARLTLDDARHIYRTDYFEAAHCPELPAPLALLVFDTAVNMGTGRAIEFLQSCIGAKADGDFGPKTRALLGRKLDETDGRGLTDDYLSYRAVFYAELAQRKPSQSRFLRGWFRRTYRLQQYLSEHGLL